LEPKNAGRARVKIAVFFVLAVHGIGLLALLMQGCHKEESSAVTQPTNSVPVFEAPTNTVVEPPPTPGTTSLPSNPPAVVDSAMAAGPGGGEYVVANGDSFYTIAKHFKIPTKALTDANPGVDPLKLKPGQKLHVPAPAPAAAPTANGTLAAAATAAATNGEMVYTVKSGDNLTTIAAHLARRSKRCEPPTASRPIASKLGKS